MCKKHHKKAPEQYTQKPKVVQESVCTDLSALWNGWRSRLVEHGGMKFRVADKAIKGKSIMAITVFSAPAGTLLRGFDKKDVYLSLKQVQAGEFFSSLEKGSEQRKDCETLWNYLHEAFVAAGLKKVVRQKRVVSKTEPMSSDIGDLLAEKTGMYSFDAKGKPRAVFEIAEIVRDDGKAKRLVKLVSAQKGHPVYGCAQWTHLHFSMLYCEGEPVLYGKQAGDMYKVWEYLTGLIAKHRSETMGKVFDSQDSSTVIAPQYGRGLAPAMEAQTS